MLSIYDLVMWAYYAAHLRRPPDPARYILDRPGWVPEGGEILDFGGGDGRWALPLAAGRNAQVTVADVSEAALRRMPAHPRLHPLLFDGRRLPIPDDAFDLVFINHVIHHVEDLAPVLRELRRVVRPGGRIVCIEFHPDCPVTRIYRVFSRFRRHPCTFFRPEELAALLSAPSSTGEYTMLDHFQYAISVRRPA